MVSGHHEHLSDVAGANPEDRSHSAGRPCPICRPGLARPRRSHDHAGGEPPAPPRQHSPRRSECGFTPEAASGKFAMMRKRLAKHQHQVAMAVPAAAPVLRALGPRLRVSAGLIPSPGRQTPPSPSLAPRLVSAVIAAAPGSARHGAHTDHHHCDARQPDWSHDVAPSCIRTNDSRIYGVDRL
jgi:hypothetical protein